MESYLFHIRQVAEQKQHAPPPGTTGFKGRTTDNGSMKCHSNNPKT